MAQTVIQHVLGRLKEIGVDDICTPDIRASQWRRLQVVTDTYEAPLLPKKLHESLKSLYDF